MRFTTVSKTMAMLIAKCGFAFLLSCSTPIKEEVKAPVVVENNPEPVKSEPTVAIVQQRQRSTQQMAYKA